MIGYLIHEIISFEQVGLEKRGNFDNDSLNIIMVIDDLFIRLFY